jgi:hypothetical protein
MNDVTVDGATINALACIEATQEQKVLLASVTTVSSAHWVFTDKTASQHELLLLHLPTVTMSESFSILE